MATKARRSRTSADYVTSLPLSALIEDLDFYPRSGVDSTHVGNLAAAFEAGAKFPPLVVERSSKRIVDGVHRSRMYRRLLGASASVDVMLRDYESDAAMFEDAVRLNSTHGRPLTHWDHARIRVRLEQLGRTPEKIGLAISRREEYVRSLAIAHRIVGNGTELREQIALKRPYRRFAGQTITSKQAEANERSGGMGLSFVAGQAIDLLDAQAFDRSPELRQRLELLRNAIDSVLKGWRE